MVLAAHAAVVVFVLAGLVVVLVGNARGWRWANNPWFRTAHLAAIACVIGQAWVGAVCPLTTFEMWLRAQAGVATYAGSFVEYWVSRLLYHDAPAWVFTVLYSVFGLAVAATWWYLPPTGWHLGRKTRHERPR